jgi:hypothetical protein
MIQGPQLHFARDGRDRGLLVRGWNELTRSTRELGDLEDQFPADMAGLNHPMRSGCELQRKHLPFGLLA